MEEYTRALADFVRDHQAWAAPIVLLLAFGESLAFISLLIPAWGALVAIEPGLWHPVGALRQFRRVIVRDESADGHARERVQKRHDSPQDLTADIFKIHVDALWARSLQLRREIGRAMVNTRIEPEFADDKIALLLPARDPYRATALDACDLSDY